MFSLINNDTLYNEPKLGRKFIIDVFAIDVLKSTG